MRPPPPSGLSTANPEGEDFPQGSNGPPSLSLLCSPNTSAAPSSHHFLGLFCCLGTGDSLGSGAKHAKTRGRGSSWAASPSRDPRLPGSHRTASTPRTLRDLRMRASRLPPPPPTTPTSRLWASMLMTGEAPTLLTAPGGPALLSAIKGQTVHVT